ncbi:archaeal proteasome endopeptidase complex subunit alpha [Caldisphaera sp.]|uniref:archaeal proteasome endopeptidase complex subunit alpha n=1 Tax=Caldisphaera sp. TaxID=2060322 RepID=UPI0025C461A5|nr:archaeal proteasome endopeptidase complex subunit alpha [Caldisphaera sp.]
MAMAAPPSAYDRAITIFSPDGELYQVRYAFEAVKKGWTSLGIMTSQGVVLAAEKRKMLPLLDLEGVEKIYKVDDHIGVTFAGMGSDGRVLIDYARQVSIRHRLTYGEAPSVEYITKSVADIKQAYTQHGGFRPFGVALIFGGVNSDNVPKLFRTEPGGQYFSYYAVAIGLGGDVANSYMEKQYNKDMSLSDAIELAVKSLFKSRAATSDEKKEELINNFGQYVEIAYVDTKQKVFTRVSEKEINDIAIDNKGELLG